MKHIDHLEVLKSKQSFRLAVDYLIRCSRIGEVSQIVAVHEHDNSCCKREHWNTTVNRLMQEAALDTIGTRVIIDTGLPKD